MATLLALGGVEVKHPTTFQIQRYNLTKSGRVASGKMTMELVAKKRKFALHYDVLSGPELDKILSVIDTDQMFFTIDYVENGVQKRATVYAGEIKQDRFRTDGVWYWRNVEFNLIEQ